MVTALVLPPPPETVELLCVWSVRVVGELRTPPCATSGSVRSLVPPTRGQSPFTGRGEAAESVAGGEISAPRWT